MEDLSIRARRLQGARISRCDRGGTVMVNAVTTTREKNTNNREMVEEAGGDEEVKVK